jgi:hypothetical protein
MKLKTNKISRKGTREKIKKLKIKRIRTEVEIPKKKSSCNFLGEREERRGKKILINNKSDHHQLHALLH